MKESFFRGMVSIGLSKYFGMAVTFVVTVILSRVLSPSEFGIVAIAVSISTLLVIIADLGISASVIQNKTLDNKDLNTLHTIVFSFGIFLGLTAFLLSNTIAGFFEEMELKKILTLFSFYIALFSLQVVPKAKLNRNRKFIKLGRIFAASQLISGIVAIIMAVEGYGLYSIVFKYIADSLASSLLYTYFSKVKFTTNIRTATLLNVFRFSLFQFLFNITSFFSRNFDNFLLGKLLGKFDLGIYDRAYQLMHMPNMLTSQVFNMVLHPVLSEKQSNNDKIYYEYRKVFFATALAGLPISAFLYFSSNEIIPIIYGSQWVNSIVVFKILAISIGFQMLTSTTGPIFQSANRTDILLVSGAINTATIILAIFFGGYFFGKLENVAMALTISFTINCFITFKIVMNKLFKREITKILSLLKEPIIYSLITCISSILVESLVNKDYDNTLLFTIRLLVTITFCLGFLKMHKQSKAKKLILELKNGLLR
jgi:PST family polysaccharide transporter